MNATTETYRPEAALIIDDKPFARISWGSIFAGAVTAFSLHLVLSLFGVGVGLTTLDPATGDNPSGQALGAGAIAWWSISALISLFVGGYLAGRTAVTFNGFVHGMITWATVNLVSALLLGTAVGGALANSTSLGQLADQRSPQWRQHGANPAAPADRGLQDGGSRAGNATGNAEDRAPSDPQTREDAQVAAKRSGSSAMGAALALVLGAIAAGFGGMAGRRAFLSATAATANGAGTAAVRG
jgi:hypothetical protein